MQKDLMHKDQSRPAHRGKAATAMADESPRIGRSIQEIVSVGPAPADPDGKIVFHCANGHRVIVPVKMAGQRGKCSKCGVAVTIPVPDEPRPLAVAVAVAVAEPVAEAVESAGSQPESHNDMFAGIVDASDSQASASEFVELSAQGGLPAQARVPAQGEQLRPESVAPEQGALAALPTHPTAALVARLFQEVEHGGIVEVHITGGSVILPEFYEARWSGGSHGLFASRAADDTVTLTAVAWDSIQKIIVRQVNGLPYGMFE